MYFHTTPLLGTACDDFRLDDVCNCVQITRNLLRYRNHYFRRTWLDHGSDRFMADAKVSSEGTQLAGRCQYPDCCRLIQRELAELWLDRCGTMGASHRLAF